MRNSSDCSISRDGTDCGFWPTKCMTGCVTRGGSIAPSILKCRAGRCGNSRAVILEDLVHDGMAIGLADLPARSVRPAAQFNEFTVSHAPSIAQRAGETASG